MKPKCSIVQCSSKKNIQHPEITYHRFPRNEELRKKWLEVIGKENINGRHKDLVLCCRHFDDSCFDRTTEGSVWLRQNSLPFPSLLYPSTCESTGSNDSKLKPEEIQKHDNAKQEAASSKAIFDLPILTATLEHMKKHSQLDKTVLSMSQSLPSKYFSSLALVWTEKLERLHPFQQVYVEKAINDILFEAELGNLNKYSITINEFQSLKPSYSVPTPSSSPSCSLITDELSLPDGAPSQNTVSSRVPSPNAICPVPSAAPSRPKSFTDHYELIHLPLLQSQYVEGTSSQMRIEPDNKSYTLQYLLNDNPRNGEDLTQDDTIGKLFTNFIP